MLVQPVMHSRRVVAVIRHQGKQHEQKGVVQHLDAGEVSDESGRHDDRALIIVGQHQVIEQLVGAAVSLVGFQGGEEAADVFSPGIKKPALCGLLLWHCLDA